MKKVIFLLLATISFSSAFSQAVQFSQGRSDMAIAFNGGIYVSGNAYLGRMRDTSVAAKTRMGAIRFDSTRRRTAVYDGISWTYIEMNVHKNAVATAVNSTATIVDSVLRKGLITSTSAAATSITLPTATALGTAFRASKGTWVEFIVDNTAGANTITIIPGTGTTATAIITGGDTMTISASATAGVGVFRITFIDATHAVISRVL